LSALSAASTRRVTRTRRWRGGSVDASDFCRFGRRRASGTHETAGHQPENPLFTQMISPTQPTQPSAVSSVLLQLRFQEHKGQQY